MSDLATRPEELVCAAAERGGPEALVLPARRVPLGRTTEVARALPHRDVRMIGAWCFLDHYGPSDIAGQPGMQVWAHPHTGLQTVSWLLEGAIEHRDGLGSHVIVRPGELHLMTAGHGIAHSELSPPQRPDALHGLQLWVALPDEARDQPPHFDSYGDLPRVRGDGWSGVVLVGSLLGTTSPAPTYTPLCGAQLDLEPGASITVALDSAYEHGVFVITGDARVADRSVATDELVYLGQNRPELTVASTGGASLLLIGGEPFATEIVMWWNFIGRSHDEVAGFRAAWERRDARFAPVISGDPHVDGRAMEAPPLPTVTLRPRPRRSRR